MTINRELFFKEAQEKIKEELNTTDQKIILYSLISEKLPKNVNELFEQIRIITDLKYPTLDQYLTIEEYCNFLLDNSLEKMNTDKKKEIEKIISGEISITFDQNEQKLVNNFSKNILDLIVLKNDLDLEISNLLKENYPNFYLIATPKIAAKMLQISGSIKRLAKMPSSTIQLLGSEKSFFKALKLSKNTPKYGVLYNHEILFDLNKKNKAKMARMIANKISIAVKSDLNKNNVSADLYEKIIRKKEELLNLQKKWIIMILKNLILDSGNYYTTDLNTKKKRFWDPNRSKICAGLKKGINMLPITADSKVLYLGSAEGYTISYISDLADNGVVIGVDISPISTQKFYLLCKERNNLLPILASANEPDSYKHLIDFKVDVIIQDVAQKNQVEILKKNADVYLKEGGFVILSLKTTAISQGKTENIINKEVEKFGKDFNIVEKKRLDPFEKKHILIIGKKK